MRGIHPAEYRAMRRPPAARTAQAPPSSAPWNAGSHPAAMSGSASLDPRKRVVAAIEGGMSCNRVAKQFGVAVSTAIG